MTAKYYHCEYCKSIAFGYTEICTFCHTPLTEITKEQFDNERLKIQKDKNDEVTTEAWPIK